MEAVARRDAKIAAVAAWTNTFPNLSHTANTINDFCDGVLLFQVLNQLDSDHFNADTLQQLLPASECKDVSDKLENLRVLCGAIRDWLLSCAAEPEADPINTEHLKLDLEKVAAAEPSHVFRLLEQALVVAVSCANANTAVEHVYMMDEKHQLNLASVISHARYVAYGAELIAARVSYRFWVASSYSFGLCAQGICMRGCCLAMVCLGLPSLAHSAVLSPCAFTLLFLAHLSFCSSYHPLFFSVSCFQNQALWHHERRPECVSHAVPRDAPHVKQQQQQSLFRIRHPLKTQAL